MIKKINIIAISLLLLFLILIPANFAADVDNETISIDGDSDIVTVMDFDNETLSVNDDSDAVTASHYYFDASASTDGDGSIDSPFNKVTSRRIKNNYILHFANGEYSFTGSKSVTTLTIIGEDADKTIFRANGLLFTVSGTLTIENMTFLKTTIDNQGNITANNVIFDGGVAVDSEDGYGNTFGGTIWNNAFVTVDGDGNIVSVTNANLYLTNCTIRNSYGDYGGAIYSSGGIVSITDSTFYNNTAYNFGGAIAREYEGTLTISNSRFYNNSALTDAGGAVYAVNSVLNVNDSVFENGSATFGGAICALSSTTNIINITGKSNGAKYDGGAIYVMYGSTFITDSNFSENTAKNGGALLIDDTDSFTLTNSNFTSNIAYVCAGAVYSLFNTQKNIINVNYGGNYALIHNDFYETNELNLTVGNGNYTEYVYDDSNYDGVLPAKFDLRTYGWVTPVKDQETSGNCWAFAAIAALESCILKASGDSLDLSEENLKNVIELYSDYGWDMLTNDGGFGEMAIGYFTGWLGAVFEDEDPFDDKGLLSPVLDSSIHVQNVLYLSRSSFTDNDAIKEAIMKYGAVAAKYHQDGDYFDDDNAAYYYNGAQYPNHAITVVGWNDNYKKSNFLNTPDGNGAWIVKNSWNTDWGKNGYFYISYYDTTLFQVGQSNTAYTFILNDTIHYDKNYQYDVIGFTGFYDYFSGNTIWYQNVFTATDDELIAAFSTAFCEDTTWEAYIYVNNELKTTQQGFSNAGYYTYNLDEFVPIHAGDVFKVTLKVNVSSSKVRLPYVFGEYYQNRITCRAGISYYSYDGYSWQDFYSPYFIKELSIKAFTITEDIQTSINVINPIDEGEAWNDINILASVNDRYGRPVVDGEVTIYYANETKTVNLIDGYLNTTISFDKGGDYSVTLVYQSDYYLASNTTFNIRITKPKVYFDPTYFEMGLGEDKNLTVTVTDVKGRILEVPVAIEINNQPVDNKTSFNGEITFDELKYWATGIYDIVLTVDTSQYSGNATVRVNIGKAIPKFTIEDSITLYVGESYTIIPTDVIPENGEFEYSTSDSSIIDIENNVITTKRGGVAVVNVTLKESADYAALTKELVVIVNLNVTEVSAEDIIVLVGGNATINPVVTPENLTVTYTVGDESIISIVNGNVFALKGGNTTVTLTVGDGIIYEFSSTTINVEVKKLPTNILFDEDSITLRIGESVGFTAVLTPADAGTLSYASSDDYIIDYNNGIITALHGGSAFITVSYAGNDYYEASSKTINVTVNLNDAKVIAEDIVLLIDTSTTISPVTIPGDLEVTYTVGDESIINLVDNTVYALRGGNTTITLTVGDGITYAFNSTTINVEVTRIPTVIEVNADTVSVNVGENTFIEASLDPNVGELEYASSNDEVALVINGLVIGNKAGNAVITVFYGGDDRYGPSSKTINVTVNFNDASVYANDIEMFIGDTTTIYPNCVPFILSVNYASADSSIATVDANGVVTGIKGGNTTITLTVGDGEFYAINSTTINVVVKKYDAEIICENDAITMGVDENINIGATLNPSNAGTLSYLSTDESIVTVENGVITGIREGSASIIISSSGNDYYNPANSKIINVTVVLSDASVYAEDMVLFIDDVRAINPIVTPSYLTVNYAVLDDTIASVDENGVVTALSEGTTTITITINGGGDYINNSTTINVTVYKIATEITVNEEIISLKSIESKMANVSLTPAEAGSLKFVSNNLDIVSVDENTGLITAIRQGNATVTVFFNGNEKYAASENKTIYVSVALADASVYALDIVLYVDDNATVNPTVNPNVLNVNYSGFDSSIISVDENGVVTALSEGTTAITITIDGEGIYVNNSTTINVTVNRISTSIVVNNTLFILKFGETEYVGAILSPFEEGSLKYVSNNPDGVAVDKDTGLITALRQGNATITVSFEGNNKYLAAEKIILVYVMLADASVSAEDVEIFVGDGTFINITTTPEGLNITCSVDNLDIASVSSNGEVFGISEGSTKITIYIQSNDMYFQNSTTIDVIVKKVPTEIIVDNPSIYLKAGGSEDLNVNLTPADAGSLSFVSSDESVVKVENGKIMAVSTGNATIEISFAGNNRYESSYNVINVTVGLNNAIVSAEDIEMFIGDNVNIIFVTNPDGLDVAYAVADSSIVTVDDNGTVRGLKYGNTTITLTVGDGIVYAKNSTTINVAVNKIATEIILNKEVISLSSGGTGFVDAALSPAEAGLLKYISNNPDVVSVDENTGLITALNRGNATITVSFGGNDKYASASDKTVEVMVSLNGAGVSAEDIEVFVGNTAEIIPVTNPDGLNVTYVVEDSSIARVYDNGTVVGLKYGNTTITLTVGDGVIYAKNSTTINVVVNKIPTSIVLDSDSVALHVGENQTINAILTPAGAGNISFVCDDESIVKVENGKIMAVGEGSATVTVFFEGNDFYAPAANKTIGVTVSLNDASVIASDIALFVGENTTLGAVTTPEGLNITYNIAEDGIIDIVDGVVIGLKEGNTTVVLSVGDGVIYAVNTTTINVAVNKIKTSISVDDDAILLNVGESQFINATLTPADAGALSYVSSNENVVKVENGVIIAVGEGSANVTVSFAGDDTYMASYKIINVGVGLIDTTISAKDIEITVGENATIDVVTTPEGLNVTYSIAEDGIIDIVDGVVIGLKGGNTTVVLSVGDGVSYVINTTTINVVVNRIKTSINVNDNIALTVGESQAIDATLTPADAGTLSYVSSDESVVKVEDGKVIAVGGGSAAVTVSFAGDDTYCASFKTINVTVSLNDASVSAKDIEITVGENATIDAVTTPEGLNVSYVIANDGIIGIVDGKVVGLKEGNTTVILSVGDNVTYAVNTTTIKVTVNKIATSITVNNDSVALKVGGTQLIDATLTPEDAGNLSFVSSDESIVKVENGEIIAVGAGNATINVNYLGNDKYKKSNATISVVVSKRDFDIEMDTYDINVTQKDAVIAVVTLPGDASGFVNVTVGEDTFSIEINNNTVHGLNGIIIMSIYNNGYSAGAHNISAVYANRMYNPSSANGTFNVLKVSFTPNITSEKAKVIVDVPDDAVGDVNLTVNGETFTAPIENGTALFDLSRLPTGEYIARVFYLGDENYNGFEDVIQVTIDNRIVVTAEDVTKYFHGSERFVVIVSNGNGELLSNKSVTININGASYTRLTNENGSASIALGLGAGVYNVTSTVDNMTVNSVVTVLTTVNGTDVVKVFRNGTQYYATFRDSEGNYLDDGSVVRFNINGVFYERQVLGSEGRARLNLNLVQGEYILTAINPVTGEESSNLITIIPKIIENRDITKYFRNGTQYTVKILGDDGNPVGAGKEVTFNINGVLYKRTTNESGIARMNINLNPGEYVITAEYGGCVVSNSILIKPTLTANDLTKKYRTSDPFIATLVDGQGNPLAGKTVSFNINGVIYNRTTNATGQARLNINLVRGEYIITSSYGGAVISNTVKIN